MKAGNWVQENDVRDDGGVEGVDVVGGVNVKEGLVRLVFLEQVRVDPTLDPKCLRNVPTNSQNGDSQH
jgi:hypothetical protein